MIHTKSLIRRLAYVPWLLAFGLVVGWAGEAEAAIKAVTLDGKAKIMVREDDGEQTIKVKVTSTAKVKAPTSVTLLLDAGNDQLNKRFRVTLPSLVIAKDKDAIEGTIMFEPINDKKRGDDLKNEGSMDDLKITIRATDTSTSGGKTAEITLLDDDKLSTKLDFTFDPLELKKDAPEQNIGLTATLDGSLLGDDYTFPLGFRNTLSSLENSGVEDAPKAAEILRRDSEYRASSADLRLRRKRKSGTVNFSFTPKNKAGYVAIEATLPADKQAPVVGEDDDPKVLKDRKNDNRETSTESIGTKNGYSLLATGIDLDFDGDTGDKYALVPYYHPDQVEITVTLDGTETLKKVKVPNIHRGRLTEKVLSEGNITGDELVDFGGANADGTVPDPNPPDGRSVSYAADAKEVSQYVSEAQFGIDLNGDGDMNDGGAPPAAAVQITDGASFNTAVPSGTTALIGATTATAIGDVTNARGAIDITPLSGNTFVSDEAGVTNRLTAAQKYTLAVKAAMDAIDVSLRGADASVETPTDDDDGEANTSSAIYWPPYPDYKAPENRPNLEHENANNPTELVEKELKFAVTVNPGFFKIAEATLAAVKKGGDGLKVSPAVIRENAGEQPLEIKVILQNKLAKNITVDFEVEEDSGVRDQDYEVNVEDLEIEAGQTEATTTLILTPTDNDEADGEKNFVLKATVGDGSVVGEAEIRIVDDESITTNIKLSVKPGTVKVGTGINNVDVTAEINGMPFEEDVQVTLVLGPKDKEVAGGSVKATATAQRDIDFEATLRSLTIPANAVTGSISIDVEALTGGDKKVVVQALKSPIKNADQEDVTVDPATIVLKDADAPDPEADAPVVFGFSETDLDRLATVFEGTVGKEFDEELPEATGGEGSLTYSVSDALPAGLMFDAAERKISGMPAMAGDATVVYTVIDSLGKSAAAKFTIEIGAAPPPMAEVSKVSVSQSSVRENGDSTEISVKATLAKAAPVAEKVSFTIGAPSSGTAAVRDVDYSASIVGSVAIEKGATTAITMMTITPINNDEEDGNRFLTVQAASSGGSASADIKIADDETASTSISLSASPNTVSENDGVTEVTITATLDGKVLDSDATVTLSIDPASEATRDVDYSALFNPILTIAAGQISGSVDLLIDPTADKVDEGNETATLKGAIEGLIDGSGTITIEDYAMPEDPAMPMLMFAEGTMIDDMAFTAGTEITAVELPAAEGGSGDIAYSVSDLPAGLSFDPATRMISGTPEAEGTTEVTYTATDSEGATTEKTFSITVNPTLDFGDLGALFGSFTGAGKANPADEHDDGVIPLVVGQPVDLTLPEVSGGTPPLVYSVSGLPAGLSFDPATRTISGAATEVSDAVVVTYTVTDASGASNSLPFLVSVVEPPLGAPSNLVAQDYMGADGQGDQGGFILLTWELSEHHDGIDGYRIFRALPVLGNEMVPWAMVDAVPGVERGVAVVATLDNVATRWGIAAERGRSAPRSLLLLRPCLSALKTSPTRRWPRR